MKFAVSKGEKEIAELVARIFEVRSKGDGEAAKSAETALLNANPHLRDLSKVHAGTLIVIPDLPDNPPLRDSQTVGVGAAQNDHLKDALKELNDVIDRASESEKQAADATAAFLQGSDIKSFKKESPELEEYFKKISNAATIQLKEAKATGAAQKKALAELQEALAKSNL